MHGSGDALPQNVLPSSVAVLAQLIERYVSDLVSAAMDAHDIFTDGEVVGGGACLPMPPFGYESSKRYSNNSNEEEEKLKEEIRRLDRDDDGANHGFDDRQSVKSTSTASTVRRRKRRSKRKLEKLLEKRRKRSEIDYWDEPLPPPKEDDSESEDDSSDDSDSYDDSSDESDDSSDESDDDAPLLLSSSSLRASNFARSLSQASAATGTSLNSAANTNDDDDDDGDEEEDVLVSQWQGVLPVDLHSTQRTRKYYVAAPTAMDARSFIFPICHDALLYQRVKEVQASRRSIEREVVENQCWMEVLREEGAVIGRGGVADVWDVVFGGKDGSAGGAVTGGAVTGPGGSGSGNPNGDGGKKIAATSEKTKSVIGADEGKGNQKDGDKSSTATVSGKEERGKSIVEAGLVDTANADPTWPGLEALSRGTMW
ncbi:hypothetical protein ACHAXS_010502 [Conticribra weissflogii]